MVDICLICEGTYPYITGGVSAWTHNLIKDFANFTFGVVHISSKKDPFREFKYKLPPNVIEYIEVPIHEPVIDSDGSNEMKSDSFDFYSFHQEIKKGDHSRFAQILKRVSPDGFGGSGGAESETPARPDKITGEKILYSKEAFDIITNLYKQCGLSTSFIDYYWTFRTTHLPLLQILNAPILKASIYHPVSTGYAGLYAVTAKMKTGSPIILTEHGIYTVERKIEVAEASWMLDEGMGSLKLQAQLGKIKDFWIKIFDFLSRLTYRHADELISLYSENKKMQVSLGADEGRIRLIPNGIDIEKYENLKGRMGGTDAVLKVGFVGRVVPVKDVETFVKAAKIIKDSLAGVEFYIIGPDDEDADYAREIRNLVSSLDMANHIKFTGLANTADYYKIIDVLVLTSITEVQPLVILEALIAGVPVVATNVGACREMLYGDSPEDAAIGRCGIITAIKAPDETAAAVVKILKDPVMWREMAITGQKRVRRYYQKKNLCAQYRKLYFGMLASKIREIRS